VGKHDEDGPATLDRHNDSYSISSRDAGGDRGFVLVYCLANGVSYSIFAPEGRRRKARDVSPWERGCDPSNKPWRGDTLRNPHADVAPSELTAARALFLQGLASLAT
jgi:hypothetical protein